MALVDCKGCGKQVREQDLHCWNCGAGMRPGVGQKKIATGGGAGAALAMVVVLAVVGYCSLSDARSSANASSDSGTGPSAVAPTDALSQAELAFVGGYTREHIKDRLGTALRLYGLPTTEENYSRAGSALVALRKQNGTPEMEILDHMIRSHVNGVNISFPDAAGISSAFLAAGDR